MKAVSNNAWELWAVLADGARHHVRDIAAAVGCEVNSLYPYWKQLPVEIQKYLRQQDGWWQLQQPMAVVSPTQAQCIQARSGFETTALIEVGSTNDELWLRWQDKQNIHKHMICALQQTQGRGRLQRPWQNQLGQTLMFSLAYQFTQPPQNLSALTLVVGLVVQQTLQEQQVPAQLKWPNDLVIGSLKLGGILVESKFRGEHLCVVVGIGINVMQPKQSELANIATGCHAKVSQFDSAKFLEQCLSRLNQALECFFAQGFAPFQDAYVANMRDMKQAVNLFERGVLIGSGCVVGVNELGALEVEDDMGQKQVYINGEVSMRPETAIDVPAGVDNQTTKEEIKPAVAAHIALAHEALNQKAQKPSARYILLDGGNSQLKWAWVDEERELHFGGRAPYANLNAFAEFIRAQAPNLDIIGCAVCGSKKMAAVEQAADKSIRWLPSMRHALGVTNHYYKVQQHGADRWFNVLGSRLFTQNSCVVVSCGTAITTDAVTHDNHYLGGSIMPGFNLMKEAMAAKTANLNQPIGKAYPFATSTSNALASGMHDAACGAVVLMHERLKQRQQDLSVDIILTGGGAAKIEQHLPRSLISDSQVKIVDNLVLYGLQNWVEHTCNY